MDMAFLTERLRGLTLFLDLLQEHRVLLHQNAVLDFVGLPGSGSAFLGTVAVDSAWQPTRALTSRRAAGAPRCRPPRRHAHARRTRLHPVRA